MSDAEAQLRLDVETPQLTWTPPTGRRVCGRDPAAGPGSCPFWWEGCPNAERRRCFRLWAISEALLAHWSRSAPMTWTPGPDDLHPITAGALRDRRQIELRTPEGALWEWRRAATVTD